MQRQTTIANAKTVTRKWYVIDATNLPLGRLASEIARHLTGKNKPIYTPNVDCGDYIIVINASKVALSGDAENKKTYYEYIAKCGSIFQEGLELTKKLLREHNATKDRPLEFDVFVDAPAIISTDFDDDVADCYISKLYIDGEDIFADLYAYYIGDDRTDIHLNKEYNTNWAEIITYLI